MSNTPTWYPPGLPQWNGSNAAGQPALSNTQGYDVTAPRLSDARRSAAYKAANATLSDGNFYWPLFVVDVRIDLSLAGQTAQAQLTRDFYPHNMVMPSFVVQGQALDQEDYGYLCEFVHQAQLASVSGGNPLLQFWLNKGGGDSGIGSGNQVTLTSKLPDPVSQTAANGKMRGGHERITAQGYINAMPRQHQKGVVSPTYTFNFVVAEMIKGALYHEQTQPSLQQKSWIDILQATSAQEFATGKSVLWNNKWILNWASKNQGGIFNSGS